MERETVAAPARMTKLPLRVRPSDALLPAALVLWLVALQGVRIDAINDWGLLSALPVTFFVAVGLLLVSIAFALTDEELSPLRLGLHAVALVFVLQGTIALLFPEPNYPWVYKHVGVVGYINLHGAVNPTVDIYQNWPGFFAVAAFFTKIAGVGSPLAFAKWAPVYFNLFFCLELAFVLRALPLTRRTRWLAVFLFIAANWVGQDYFAPQALAFGLSLAVFGIVLKWLRVDRQPALVRAAGRLARRMLRAPEKVRADAPGDELSQLSGWALPLVLGSMMTMFAVVVFSHQLSPFLVLFGIALLAAAGMVRPRWVVVALGAIVFGYLALHLTYLRSEGHLAGSPFNPRELIGALSNPFDNAHSAGFSSANPMPGRSITALASPVLILGLWALAAVGAVRRVRNGLPALLLVLLAASPAFLVVGQNYGGEALGLVAPNVPARVGARYDEFTRGSTPPPLSTIEGFQNHLLGAGDLSALSNLYREHAQDTRGDMYLSLSTDQQVYVEVLGLMPSGSLANLDRALASSSEWQLFYRNGDAVIYQFVGV
jgi:hypothetical protein